MPTLEETFAKLLEEAFPDATFLWKGDSYDVYEVADAKGLLPVVLAQAKKTAAVFPDNLLDELKIQNSTKTLTGNTVVSSRNSSVALVIALPFLLDAVYLARGEQSEAMPSIINFDAIDPALEPSLTDVLNCSPIEPNLPENQVLPE